jgi:hypothetical protein
MEISAGKNLTLNLQKLFHYQFDMRASPDFDPILFDNKFQ